MVSLEELFAPVETGLAGVELRLQEGEVIRVTLVAVERDVLHVNQRVGGGSMSYAVPMELINEIHVAK